ncbi:MAG: hypothetical protein ACYSTJ_09480 [Planctomycetota bacterium]|jgi:hypothetical protein
MPEEQIGTVSDFFAHPVVAAIELTAGVKVGDKIHRLSMRLLKRPRRATRLE